MDVIRGLYGFYHEIDGGQWWGKVTFWVMMALLAAGLCLSGMSLAGICSDACSEAHKYGIFGAPVAAIGIGFFAVAMVVWAFQSKTWARKFFPYLLVSAAGAEGGFIIFQMVVIGHFCTLCLWIGAVVAGTIVAKSFEFTMEIRENGKMKITSVVTSVIPKAVIGLCALLFAIAALQKPAEGSNLPDPFLGNAKSQVEVFIITDWFCPACRKVEPFIESSSKEAMKLGRVIFVDFAVHPETFNFSPYNLSFSMYEKGKYLSLRKSLAALATTEKNPSAADVQAKIAPLNVKLHQLDFNDSMAGVQFYQKVARTFNVRSTPTVIIRNVKSGMTMTLGGQDIADGKIIPSMKMMARQ